MTLRVTILGCGSSGGVPRVGGIWGACDPTEPKNRRRRCSLLVERFSKGRATRVLVDTSPDLREQLLDSRVDWLDGVLFTHDHADQSHGIDDLRPLALTHRKRVQVYMDSHTSQSLTSRFHYCFETPPGSLHIPILEANLICAGSSFSIEGEGGVISVLPFEQEHGDVLSLGFRFGQVAYSSDVVNLSQNSFELLRGLDCWIVDALRYKPHPSHAHVDLTLEWIAHIKPRLGILTNLHIDLDYHELSRALPAGVQVAYDGMQLEFPYFV